MSKKLLTKELVDADMIEKKKKDSETKVDK